MAERINVSTAFLNKPRSSWKYPHKTGGTCRMGQLVPVFIDTDLLPGTTKKSPDMRAIIRAFTLLNPFFGDVYVSFEWFFVPDRISLEFWREILGENTKTKWYPENYAEYPSVDLYEDFGAIVTGVYNDMIADGETGTQFSQWFSNTLYGRMLPFFLQRSGGTTGNTIKVHPLKAINAFKHVWNRYYRDENLQDPVVIDKNPANASAIVTDGCVWSLPYTNKNKDFFVGVLPDPQKGPTVELPLGDTAPIEYDKGAVGSPNYTYLKLLDGTKAAATTLLSGTTTGLQGTVGGNTGIVLGVDNSAALKADLSDALAASVHAVRVSIATQQFFESGARFGTRAPEFYNWSYGVDNQSLYFDDPQYIGGWTEKLNVTTVTSTASTSDGELGELGAKSETHTGGHSFVYTAAEHGTLLCMMHINQEHLYPNRVEKQYLRKDLLDTYLPTFDGIGDEPVIKAEMAITLDGNYVINANHDQVLGYQEYGAAYRFKPSTVTGMLNPYLPGSLSSWTIADKWTGTPVLGSDFLIDSGVEFNRVTVASTNLQFFSTEDIDVSEILAGINPHSYYRIDTNELYCQYSAPQFIYEIDFGLSMMAVMPVYSRPGLNKI